MRLAGFENEKMMATISKVADNDYRFMAWKGARELMYPIRFNNMDEALEYLNRYADEHEMVPLVEMTARSQVIKKIHSRIRLNRDKAKQVRAVMKQETIIFIV